MIFLLGTQLIYYGMKFNGSARLNSPVWSFVSGLHDLIVYGVWAVICALALFIVLFIVAMIADRKSKTAAPVEDVPLAPFILSPEQIEKQRQNYEQLLQAGRVVLEQERKRIEEQRKLEDQRKQEAIKARRERSATDAAHAGLDDFL